MSTLKNLIKVHITEEEKTLIDTAIDSLETNLSDKVVNLTGSERKRYGSISEQNKLFVNKVFYYSKDQSSLRSPDVDWDEFNKDYISRNLLEGYISRIKNLLDGLENTKTLHDHDCYQAALDDYSYTNYKIGTSTPGYEEKQNELKQFFTRSKSKDEDK
ncbi:MAG: hypothetical protein MI739_00320 [Bacteroidales bacterium]|nr:hypothetical protein [Bacteroidales bacterium]